MTLGDGIRRNIATVSAAERRRLRDAILALQQQHYPGARNERLAHLRRSAQERPSK